MYFIKMGEVHKVIEAIEKNGKARVFLYFLAVLICGTVVALKFMDKVL